MTALASPINATKTCEWLTFLKATYLELVSRLPPNVERRINFDAATSRG